MIANEREYRITQHAVERFEEALAKSEEQALDLHPGLRQAMREGIESQLEELCEQLVEYEARRSAGAKGI